MTVSIARYGRILAAAAFLISCGNTGSSTGWTFTTYYTAVENLHTGPSITVTGCTVRNCTHGHAGLGQFPRDFVQAVKDEGTGIITQGPRRGRYLEWSYDIGYWLDTAPLDTDGRPLQPFVTAAADRDTLPEHAKFRITDCGREKEDNSAINKTACAKFKRSTWKVLDAFTPGLGGRRHIDLYVGEENQRNFVNASAYSITTTGSTILRVK